LRKKSRSRVEDYESSLIKIRGDGYSSSLKKGHTSGTYQESASRGENVYGSSSLQKEGKNYESMLTGIGEVDLTQK